MLVAPHAVVIDHRTRSGSLSLYNPGDQPAEVSLSTFFGYPVTDSSGNFDLRTVERPAANMPSAAGWLEAFPKRMVLATEGAPDRPAPRPAAGRPCRTASTGPGWWWRPRAARVPVSGVDDSSGITVGLNLEVRTVLPLQYRKGAVATSVRASGLSAGVEGDSLCCPPSSRAAGHGRLHRHRSRRAGRLRRAHGRDVQQPGGRVLRRGSPLHRGPAGRQAAARAQYHLQVEVTTEREDLAPETLLAARPVRDSLELHLP